MSSLIHAKYVNIKIIWNKINSNLIYLNVVKIVKSPIVKVLIKAKLYVFIY